MFYINPTLSYIVDAKAKFNVEVAKFITERLSKMKSKKFDTSIAKQLISTHITSRLSEILISSPIDLIRIHNEINPFISASVDFKMGVKYIFNYKLFTKKNNDRYDAYNLASDLKIDTCTYCNRNFTNTIISENGKKISRPQFDHYFDKDSHPLLALSFFNLVPSCSTCNSVIKGRKKMDLSTHLHPYIDNELSNIRFSYRLENISSSRYAITIKSKGKAKNTIKLFQLEEIYNSNTSLLDDLIKTKEYYSDKYLSILTNSVLKNVSVSKDELYRIAFGIELDESRSLSRPFSKFKNDILKELNIVD